MLFQCCFIPWACLFKRLTNCKIITIPPHKGRNWFQKIPAMTKHTTIKCHYRNWQKLSLKIFTEILHTYTHLQLLHCTDICCYFYFTLYSVSKKAIDLTFDHNFGKCRPIYKILSLSDSWGNYVHKYHKVSSTHLNYVSALPCET